MFHHIGYNDIVLVLSVGYTCIDLQLEWDGFDTCRQPVHKWLFGSCLCVLSCRLLRLLAWWTCSDAENGAGRQHAAHRDWSSIGEYLLDVSHESVVHRWVGQLAWTLCIPFFAFWNLIGTVWLWQVLRETPACNADATYLWFSCVWLLLCHAWFAMLVRLALRARRLKGQVEHLEAILRDVEGPEVLERWGAISRMTDVRGFGEKAADAGLPPEAIAALPCERVPPCGFLNVCAHDCAICLTDMQPGECVRCLPGCGHRFHRSCIDPWLVRQAECPLCKRAVVDSCV